jgi:AbrB family looped-hinge helix DNA binding protein
MTAVTISPKFQIVIPKEVREEFNLEPGQKIEVLVYDGQIKLIPVRPMREMRGFARGIDTTIEREPDRDL